VQHSVVAWLWHTTHIGPETAPLATRITENKFKLSETLRYGVNSRTDRRMDREHRLKPHCINTRRIFKYFLQLTCSWQAELDLAELSRCTCDRGQHNRQQQTRLSSSWGVPATSHTARCQMFETIPTQHLVGMDYIFKYTLYSTYTQPGNLTISVQWQLAIKKTDHQNWSIPHCVW